MVALLIAPLAVDLCVALGKMKTDTKYRKKISLIASLKSSKLYKTIEKIICAVLDRFRRVVASTQINTLNLAEKQLKLFETIFRKKSNFFSEIHVDKQFLWEKLQHLDIKIFQDTNHSILEKYHALIGNELDLQDHIFKELSHSLSEGLLINMNQYFSLFPDSNSKVMHTYFESSENDQEAPFDQILSIFIRIFLQKIDVLTEENKIWFFPLVYARKGYFETAASLSLNASMTPPEYKEKLTDLMNVLSSAPKRKIELSFESPKETHKTFVRFLENKGYKVYDERWGISRWIDQNVLAAFIHSYICRYKYLNCKVYPLF